MKKKNSSPTDYHEAAMHIIANKLFSDYIMCSKMIAPTEPEHFVEEWIEKNILKPSEKAKKLIWTYFMQNLLIYSRDQKKKTK